MPFGSWYPLAEAAAQAPPGPGVFQVRLATGLRDYPRGRSAMLHYELATDVRAAAGAFATAHAGAPWVCRHALDVAADAAPALYALVLGQFEARFGARPSVAT